MIWFDEPMPEVNPELAARLLAPPPVEQPNLLARNTTCGASCCGGSC